MHGKLLAPVRAEHRHAHVGFRAHRHHEPLQRASVHDRTVADRDDDVTVLHPGLRGGRPLDHLDDHHAEPLADPVLLRELVHLLLGQIANAHAEPGVRPRFREPGRDRDEHRRQNDRADRHSRPPRSSVTSASRPLATRPSRSPTSSVSRSS